MSELKERVSARTMLEDPALRTVCRWRLTNGEKNDPEEDVAFAREHRVGFFRLAKDAVSRMEEKEL